MDTFPFSSTSLDRRRDCRTAVEVDRGIFLQQYYGIIWGARYMFTRGICLKIALRVLLLNEKRSTDNYYLPLPSRNIKY